MLKFTWKQARNARTQGWIMCYIPTPIVFFSLSLLPKLMEEWRKRGTRMHL